MAANDLKDALRSSASAIAKYVEDVGTLTVTTSTQEVGQPNSEPVVAARTIIRMDGDNESVLPVQLEGDVLMVDATLYDLHQQNVNAAIEYRARMLDAMLGLLKSYRGR